MNALLEVYWRRVDLQKAFPEASALKLNRLMQWAAEVAAHTWEDSAYATLRPNADWYEQTAYGNLYRKMPPKRMRAEIGARNYRKGGQDFVQHLITEGQLAPTARVLDVGCGCGRMALPLTHYLISGSYEGFDANRKYVSWCRKNITTEYPNFGFEHTDVLNELYNPNGKIKACELTFKYDNNSFDFVFLASVFTHMLPVDMEHYMSEITRVLKDGGTCFITFFLLNAESEQLLTEKRSDMNFLPRRNDERYRTINYGRPEDAVAYPETYIRQLYEKNGFTINPPVFYGSWCQRKDPLNYQDIVVARKQAPA